MRQDIVKQILCVLVQFCFFNPFQNIVFVLSKLKDGQSSVYVLISTHFWGVMSVIEFGQSQIVVSRFTYCL